MIKTEGLRAEMRKADTRAAALIARMKRTGDERGAMLARNIREDIRAALVAVEG